MVEIAVITVVVLIIVVVVIITKIFVHIHFSVLQLFGAPLLGSLP